MAQTTNVVTTRGGRKINSRSIHANDNIPSPPDPTQAPSQLQSRRRRNVVNYNYNNRTPPKVAKGSSKASAKASVTTRPAEKGTNKKRAAKGTTKKRAAMKAAAIQAKCAKKSKFHSAFGQDVPPSKGAGSTTSLTQSKSPTVASSTAKQSGQEKLDFTSDSESSLCEPVPSSDDDSVFLGIVNPCKSYCFSDDEHVENNDLQEHCLPKHYAYPSITRYTQPFETLYLCDQQGRMQGKLTGTELFSFNKSKGAAPPFCPKYNLDPWNLLQAKNVHASYENISSTTSYRSLPGSVLLARQNLRDLPDYWYNKCETFHYDWMSDSVMELIDRMNKASMVSSEKINENASFMKAWRFINMVMDDTELIDYGHSSMGKNTSFLWQLDSFLPIMDYVMPSIFESSEPGRHSSWMDQCRSGHLELQFLGFVSVHRDTDGNIILWEPDAFILYYYDDVEKVTMVELTFIKADLLYSTFDLRLLQIIQLIQVHRGYRYRDSSNDTPSMILRMDIMQHQIDDGHCDWIITEYEEMGFELIYKEPYKMLIIHSVLMTPRFTSISSLLKYQPMFQLGGCQDALYHHDVMSPQLARILSHFAEYLTKPIQISSRIHGFYSFEPCEAKDAHIKMMKDQFTNLFGLQVHKPWESNPDQWHKVVVYNARPKISLSQFNHVMAHILGNTGKNGKGGGGMVMEFFNEVTKDIEVDVAEPHPYFVVYPGDMHECQLYCRKCNRNFGPRTDIATLMTLAPSHILDHYGLGLNWNTVLAGIVNQKQDSHLCHVSTLAPYMFSSVKQLQDHIERRNQEELKHKKDGNHQTRCVHHACGDLLSHKADKSYPHLHGFENGQQAELTEDHSKQVRAIYSSMLNLTDALKMDLNYNTFEDHRKAKCMTECVIHVLFEFIVPARALMFGLFETEIDKMHQDIHAGHQSLPEGVAEWQQYYDKATDDNCLDNQNKLRDHASMVPNTQGARDSALNSKSERIMSSMYELINTLLIQNIKEVLPVQK